MIQVGTWTWVSSKIEERPINIRLFKDEKYMVLVMLPTDSKLSSHG